MDNAKFNAWYDGLKTDIKKKLKTKRWQHRLQGAGTVVGFLIVARLLLWMVGC